MICSPCVALPKYIVANCSWSCVYCVIVLCVLWLHHVYFVFCCPIHFSRRIAGLEVQYPEGPATGHLRTHFLGFPVSVYKRMLRWFPRLQVATACFSCSPPDLSFLVPYFVFMYMQYNHCHRLTAKLQLINYYFK